MCFLIFFPCLNESPQVIHMKDFSGASWVSETASLISQPNDSNSRKKKLNIIF